MTRRVSLVTGTSSGLAWHTAVELARHGDRVFAGMRDPAERNRGPPAGWPRRRRRRGSRSRSCPWT